MKNKYITYILAAVALLAVGYFASCPDKPKKDTLLEEIKLLNQSKEKVLVDSIQKLNDSISLRDVTINNLKNQIDSVRKQKQTVSYDKTNYTKAKEKKDTVWMLAACDSLADNFEQYVKLDKIEQRRTDSTFGEYEKQINDFKKQIVLKDGVVEINKNTVLILESVLKDKNKQIKKLRNKAVRERVIAGTLIAAGIISTIIK